MASNKSKLNISVLVLTKNEGKLLAECLKELDFAREIIVLDQSSSDATKSVAARYTKNILTSSSSNFANNRNLLASAAKCDWLLYLDTDERVSEDNIEEIKKAIASEQFQAYYFPRKNIVLGKWLKHGGWWPDYVPRLFKKDSLDSWHGDVHESPKIKGSFGYFSCPITHKTARSLDQMLSKSIVWAQIEAKLYQRAGFKKVRITTVLKATIREFLRRYFKKMGILDGTVGLIEAIYQALHQAIILVYLWEIQNKTEQQFKKIKNE